VNDECQMAWHKKIFCPLIFLKRLRKTTKKKPLGTVILSDIRTGHYPNASQRHVRQLDRFVSPYIVQGCAVDTNAFHHFHVLSVASVDRRFKLLVD
jgi:hypothetical protein